MGGIEMSVGEPQAGDPSAERFSDAHDDPVDRRRADAEGARKAGRERRRPVGRRGQQQQPGDRARRVEALDFGPSQLVQRLSPPASIP